MKSYAEFMKTSEPKQLHESVEHVNSADSDQEIIAEALLIEEHFGSLAPVISESRELTGDIILEGVFLQAEKLNKNRRIYSRQILEVAVEKYRKEHKNKLMLGELGHPQRAHLEVDKACISFEDFWWKGNDLYARARVLDTKDGEKLAAMIRAGLNPGVSSRGLGSLTRKGDHFVVNSDFRITVLADVVLNPSAPDAVINVK